MKNLIRFSVLAVLFLASQISVAENTSRAKLIDELMGKVDQIIQKDTVKLRSDLAGIIQMELITKPASMPVEIEHALGFINTDILKKHEYYLASDELEGRNAGYPGNNKATEYIAGVFKEIGLAPIGDKNTAGLPTYFQSFKFLNDKFETRNCVGLWEGTDALLKNEYVVIGAHCDHVGKRGQENGGQLIGENDDPNDDIWNGADDNASGASVVMAIARAFTQGKIAAKRSIIFICFSAEEWGLFGSRHYVEHPIMPLDKTVAMVNMDMVGRHAGGPFSVGGSQTFVEDEEIRNVIKDSARFVGLPVRASSKYEWVSGNSDHASFAAKDIPALFFSHGGNNPDYHKVGDSPDKITYQNMAMIGRAVFLVTRHLANLQPRPQFSKNFKVHNSPLGIAPHLGVSISELKADDCKSAGLAEGVGGVKINSIEEGSVAGNIGLKAGDIIFSFDDRNLPLKGSDGELRRQIRAVKKAKHYNIKVLRSHEEMAFIAKWDEDASSIVLEKYLTLAKDISMPERSYLEGLIGKEYPEMVEWLYDREQWARALKTLDEKLGLWASGIDIKVTFGESQFGTFGQGSGFNGKGKIQFSVPRLVEWWNKFHELGSPMVHELTHVYTGGISKYGAWLAEGMANFAQDNKIALSSIAGEFSASGKLLDVESTKVIPEARGMLFLEYMASTYPEKFKDFVGFVVYDDEDYREAAEYSSAPEEFAAEKDWQTISREETQWSASRLAQFLKTGK